MTPNLNIIVVLYLLRALIATTHYRFETKLNARQAIHSHPDNLLEH